MITLTLDQLAHEVWRRGGELRLVDGRLRYRGSTLAPDDPLAVALGAHRDALIRLATDWEAAAQRRRGHAARRGSEESSVEVSAA